MGYFGPVGGDDGPLAPDPGVSEVSIGTHTYIPKGSLGGPFTKGGRPDQPTLLDQPAGTNVISTHPTHDNMPQTASGAAPFGHGSAVTEPAGMDQVGYRPLPGNAPTPSWGPAGIAPKVRTVSNPNSKTGLPTPPSGNPVAAMTPPGSGGGKQGSITPPRASGASDQS